MIIAERPGLRLKDDAAPGRPAYFWWFIVNGLALCFAVASWLVCLEVFGHPEVPRNYEILRRIGRLPELKLFPAGDLPDGVTLDAASPSSTRRSSGSASEEEDASGVRRPMAAGPSATPLASCRATSARHSAG